MRNFIIAAALVTLAGSAEAAEPHTWYMLSASNDPCDVVPFTPESFQLGVNGRYTAERIATSDVNKDGYGDIIVTVRGTADGNPVHWTFYTSKLACDLTAKVQAPAMASSADVN